MARKTQEFTVNIHMPEDPDSFKQSYTNFLYGIALSTMKKLPPEQQKVYAEKYIKVLGS